jgi:hypothetical protein
MSRKNTLRRFMVREEDGGSTGGTPANSAGGGQVAGVKPGDDPVVYPTDQKRWRDQNDEEDSFGGHRVFEVDDDTIRLAKDWKKPQHRYDRYFSEKMRASGRAEEIRRYGRSDSKKNIMLKDGRTGAMVFMRRPFPAGLGESTELLREAITVDDLSKVIQQANALASVLHVFTEHYTGSKFPKVGEIQAITDLSILRELAEEVREFIKLYKTASK